MRNSETESDYKKLKKYFDDLNARHTALTEWEARHPDRNSEEYENDVRSYNEYQNWLNDGTKFHAQTSSIWEGASSFVPSDIKPCTSDLLTAQRFLQIVSVTLAAYEQGELA